MRVKNMKEILVFLVIISLLSGESLIEAIKKGNIKAIENFVEKGGSPDYRPKTPANFILNNSLLHFAARFNRPKIGAYLIEKGARIDIKNKLGETPLHVAVRKKSLDMVELLLARGADPNATTDSLNTPLHVAAEVGNCEAGILLLLNPNKQADVMAKNKDGDTPLFVALQSNTCMATLLLYYFTSHYTGKALKIFLNSTNKKGFTPLTESILLGNFPAFLLLIDQKGVDINLKDKDGRTPLHYAVEMKNFQMVKFLFPKKGKKAKIQEDSKGKTPIDYAWEANSLNILDYLLANSGERIRRRYRWPELYSFIFSNNLAYIKKNVSKYDLRWKDRFGRTALHIAAYHGSKEIVKVLLNNGAPIRAVDDLGNNPLHYAVMGKNYATAEILLLKDGKLLTMKNEGGLTPLDIAKGEGDEKMVGLLTKEK